MEYDYEALFLVGMHLMFLFGACILCGSVFLAIERRNFFWMAPGIAWFLLLGIALEGEPFLQNIYSEWPTWSTSIPADTLLQLIFAGFTILLSTLVAGKLYIQRKQ